MSKTLFITGATDGIGLETTKKVIKQGHRVLLHGRNPEKVENLLTQLSKFGVVEGYIADLSNINAVRRLSTQILNRHNKLDVLINNAGVFKTPHIMTKDGLDIRFAVNTVAPYLLTKQLLPLLSNGSRVINVASAAQASVNIDAFLGKLTGLADMEVYSQSKLAMIMCSNMMAKSIDQNKTVFVSVNPGSLLGTKMVKEGFGIMGKDINIGVEILARLALQEEVLAVSGEYFNNDIGKFSSPHPDALDEKKCSQLLKAMKSIL
jgi:NAD(P)-dependent dehydrogenase (short-subunit alcohol dehydrogenase family)